MMGRITRIELRRSPAAGIALLSLAVGSALLVSFPQGFAGRWMQLAVTNRTMLLVLWPLALAGGAWLGRRDARNRVDELFASTARPRWQRVLPTAGALAVAVAAVPALMFLLGAVWVVPTSGYFPISALAVTGVGALSVVAAAWLGMAAGRAVPRLVTAPVLAIIAVALVGMLPDWLTVSASVNGRPTPAATLLSPVYTGGLDDIQTVVARVNLIQTLWLAALAATGLLLVGAVGRRAIALAVLPAVFGAAVAIPLMPTGGYGGAVATDPEAAELVCDNDGPQVCVTRVHAALLPDVVGPARQALAVLAAKLPNAPTRAVETQQPATWARPGPAPASARHDAGTLVFDPPTIGRTGRADLSGDYFPRSLLESALRQECGEQAYHTDDEWHEWQARQVAAAWLVGQAPTVPDGWEPGERERINRAYRTLVGLPAAEQRRRMAAVREAVLACRTDAFAAIVPTDTP